LFHAEDAEDVERSGKRTVDDIGWERYSYNNGG